MINLVALLQAPEDGDGVLHRGLIHHHRLEPPFQSRVLLNILPVLVQGSGPNAVELAPGQHGLQQISRVHGALGFPRSHNGVQLIDEQEDLSLRLFHLCQDRLQPLLKFAPVLGPCNQGPHVQGEDGLVLQILGHIPPDNPLGQALGDSGFAHAGLADEYRIIFGLPAQNPDHIPDLLITANDRVHLFLPGPAHQVRAVLFQGLIGILRAVRGDPLVTPDGLEGLETVLLGNAIGPQQLLHRPLGRLHQGQEQMLHRHVFVLHTGRQTLGQLEHIVYPLRYIEFVRLPAAGNPGKLVKLRLGRSFQTLHRHAQLSQNLRRQASLLLQQGQKQVQLLHLLMMMFHSQTLGALHRLQRLLCILIKVHIPHSLRSHRPPF